MKQRRQKEDLDNPTSAQGWDVAMRTPGTIPFMVLMEVIEEVVGEELCERYFMRAMTLNAKELEGYRAKQREREEIEALNQQRRQMMSAAAGSEKQLQQRIATLGREITGLQANEEVLTKFVERQDKKLGELTVKWSAIQKEKAAAYVDELSYMGLSDSLKTEITRIIENVISPAQLLKVNPSMHDPEKMMLCNALTCEFNIKCAIHGKDEHGEFDHKKFLAALRDKKHRNMPLPVMNSTENLEIAKDAIAVDKERRRAMNKLDQIKETIYQKTADIHEMTENVFKHQHHLTPRKPRPGG